MKTVLVCDDDPNVRYFMTFALTGLEWNVVALDTCNNIIERIIEHRPSVIILDNQIADAGGILTIQILKSNPVSMEIPVVLCTSDMRISELAEESGADFYISKPVDIKKLESIMKDSYKFFLKTNPGEDSTELSELA